MVWTRKKDDGRRITEVDLWMTADGKKKERTTEYNLDWGNTQDNEGERIYRRETGRIERNGAWL